MPTDSQAGLRAARRSPLARRGAPATFKGFLPLSSNFQASLCCVAVASQPSATLTVRSLPYGCSLKRRGCGRPGLSCGGVGSVGKKQEREGEQTKHERPKIHHRSALICSAGVSCLGLMSPCPASGFGGLWASI